MLSVGKLQELMTVNETVLDTALSGGNLHIPDWAANTLACKYKELGYMVEVETHQGEAALSLVW